MIEVLLSECCGSPPWFETDLCSSCREHADFIDISKKEKETKKRGVTYYQVDAFGREAGAVERKGENKWVK